MGGTIQTLVAGASLRMAQALVLAAPTLLFGVIVAGILGGRVGTAGVRRMFADGRWWLPRTLAWAVLLPVCSLGVLPVLRQLQRAGVHRRALLSFALAAPLINPFSLLYGLTIIPSEHLGLFLVAGVAVAIGAALLASRFVPAPEGQTSGPEPQGKSHSGLLSAISEAARLLTGPSLGEIAVGLFGVGLLAAILPAGSLMMSMYQGNRIAPLTTVPIAVAAYLSPERAVSIVGEMFEHTCSTGANFLLYLLGAGMNLGLLALLGKTSGWKWTVRWLAILLGLALLVGYTVDYGYPVQGMESGHTHVFDNFSAPFHGYSHPNPWELVSGKLAETASPTSLAALGLIGLLGTLGLLLRVEPIRLVWEALERRVANHGDQPAGVFSRSLPPGVLTVSGVIVAVGLAIAGAFVYYPSPEEVLADMKILRADALTAVTAGSRDHALTYLDQWDLLLKKLSIGTLLRRGLLHVEQREALEQLRGDLNQLRQSVTTGTAPEVSKAHLPRVNQSYDRCRQAFAPPG